MIKHLLNAVFVVMFTGAIAQENGSSTILLTNSLSGATNLQNVLNSLTEKQIKVSKIAYDIGYIRTKPISYQFEQESIMIKKKMVSEIYCIDGLVTISGYFTQNNPRRYDIIYDDSDAVTIEAFNELRAIISDSEAGITYTQ